MTDAFVSSCEGSAGTSSSLLDRVRLNDAAAWQRLATVYTPLVYHWCRRMGLQASDAMDVGQEVFVAVSRNIHNFRRDRPGDSFRSWLRTITSNKIIDFRRACENRELAEGGSDAQRRMVELVAEFDDETVVEETQNETRIVFRAAVESLRSEFKLRTWQAFWMVVVEQKSPDDVAQRLGITRNAVYLAKSHVLRRMKQEFAGILEVPVKTMVQPS